jgi:quercetin dioxygenase-like cupin family protein
MAAIHQRGESVFKALRPEDVVWSPFAAFPAGAQLAVRVGDPAADGPYVVRVKVPHGVRLMPHRHPEDRIYTVLSGIFYIAVGDRFDPGKMEAYAPGSVVVLPGETAHFHFARSGEYVTQVTAIGPLGLEYVDPADDPRSQAGSPGRRGPDAGLP